MNVMEMVGIVLLGDLIGTPIYYWFLMRVFRRSRENSFRRGLQARGYPEQEIDKAVADLDKKRWK